MCSEAIVLEVHFIQSWESVSEYCLDAISLYARYGTTLRPRRAGMKSLYKLVTPLLSPELLLLPRITVTVSNLTQDGYVVSLRT